jgi:putative cell wall-binding protein
MRITHLRRPAAHLAAALVCAVVLSVMPVAPAPAEAATVVWVGPTGSDVTGTGSRTAPYRSITVALAYAGPGATVNVLPGTYAASSGEVFPIVVPDGMWVRGIGPGKPKVVGDGSDSVFALTQASARISGLEIAGGGATGPGAVGSGIVVDASLGARSVTIEDCWIHDNAAADSRGGGGIAATGPDPAAGSLTVRDCLVTDNVSRGDGGGLLADGFGAVLIEDCVFKRNRAEAAGASGGGVAVSRATALTFAECEIDHNTAGDGATGHAGGFALTSSTGTLSDLLVVWNRAPGEGVAATIDQGTVKLHNCTFADNVVTPADPSVTTAVFFGAGGAYEMHSCAVWGNTPPAVTRTGLVLDKLCTDDPQFGPNEVIKDDPRFVNRAEQGANYRLRRDSWCIDILAAVQLGGTDLDGRPRIFNGNSLDPAEIDVGPYEVMPGVTRRLWGANRYETAATLWRATLTRANSAVLASGVDFPDALAASALAGAVEGPLLLVSRTGVPDSTLRLMRSLGVTGVYIVGGRKAVPEPVATRLRALGYNVVRVGGDDRYATAAQVAVEVDRLMGTRSTGRAIVARGDLFPDALAASPWAYAEGIPVLLTRPTALPPVTATALTTSASNGVYIVGGTSAVSPATESGIASAAPGAPIRRLAGADRYRTAVAVAYAATGLGPNGVADPMLGWHEVGLATGALFPDALTGGAACGAQRGVILLTTWQMASSPTADALYDNRRKVYRVTAFGGPAVMSDNVVRAAGAEVKQVFW